MNTFRSTIRIICMSLLGCAMLLAACGGSTAPTGATPKHGGTVTIVPSPVGKFACTFNPFSTGSGNCYGVQGLIYEPLVFINRIDGSATPWLAEHYSWSADARTLTFTLRQNTVWSDGSPFTSADVVFTFDLMHRFPALDVNGIWGQLRAITATDAYTVVLTFATPSLGLLWSVGAQTYIVPQHIWKDLAEPEATITHPVGTGPFTLDTYSPELYTFRRNPAYWQAGKPYVDEVRFPAYDSNTGAGVLLSQGTIDWMGVYTPYINQAYTDLDPVHNHYWFPSGPPVMLYLNLTETPFQSLTVRQAISTAIDREELAQQAESGYSQPSHPTGIPLPGFQSYLDQQLSGEAFHLDLQQARSLLAQAGFRPDGNGVLSDSAGHRLAFHLDVVNGWSDWEKMADLIAASLNTVGMSITVQRLAYSDYYQRLQDGTFDMSISWTSKGPTPFSTYDALLDSANAAPVGQPAPTNWERWIDPATDALLRAYTQATNADEQKTAIRGLERIVSDKLPAIPLIYNPYWYEYSTARFVGWPDAQHAYATPSPYISPDIEVVLLSIHER